jgi:uncharacterized SAM-binding protein YcdF (DUF218 family)
MRRAKYIVPISMVVISLGLIPLLSYRAVLQAMGDFLVVEDELYPADLIHVISGPDQRIDHGVRLYQQGYGRQLFFTGAGSQAQRAKVRAVMRGVPPSAVAIDRSRVGSTYSEALRLQEFITQSEAPIRSVILVSDAYHMRRSRWTYREVLGDQIALQMAPVPFEESQHTPYWWTFGPSRRMVVAEYLKLAFYLARYRFSRGIVQEWLTVLDQY